MTRMPYFDPAEAEGRATRIFSTDVGKSANILRMMGHSGDFIDDFAKMSRQLRFNGTLNPILREIAILRVGVLTGSRYELVHHERMVRQMGVSEDKIQAIHSGPDDQALTPLEQAVMRFTDELVKTFRASDATFQAVAAELSHRDLQELILNIGFYVMTSTFLETLEVELEAGA